MTTPQHQSETFESSGRTGSSTDNVDMATTTGPPPDVTVAPDRAETTGSARVAPDRAETTGSAGGSSAGSSAMAAETTGSVADSSAMGTESAPSPTDTSAGESLFAEHELSGLRSRWADVQASFVDEPRECVQKADSLVADVVEQLTAGFAEARSRLEDDWDQGEEVSTENLRIALKRYRDFFDRLLAV